MHAVRQLGVLFSFQLCTVGEAGKVIFFPLVLLFRDAIVIALSKRLFGEEGKLVNDAEGPCIVSALCSCSWERHCLQYGGSFPLSNFAVIFPKLFELLFRQS